MRIAWFSPTSSSADLSESIGSYVSRTVLPVIASRNKELEIEVFSNSIEDKVCGSYQHFHYLSAIERHRKDPFDVFFYNLEDLKESQFVRIHMGLYPGIVYFHDVYFSDFGPEPILNSPWKETLKLVKDSNAQWSKRGAEHSQEGPFGFRESSYAICALFSNQHNRSEFHRNVKESVLDLDDLKSYYLPLPVNLSPVEKGLEKKDLTIAFCGSPRIEDRAHILLESISSSDSEYKLKWLINHKYELAVKDLLQEYEVENVELVFGRNVYNWCNILKEADVACHLKYSVYGQLGPYLQNSISCGVPCILTNFASADSLPDSLVWKVSPGENESSEIKGVLEKLEEVSLRNLVREDQLEYAQEFFDVNVIAEEVVSILYAEKERMTKWQSTWEDVRKRARRELLAESERGKPDSQISDNFSDAEIQNVFKELGW